MASIASAVRARSLSLELKRVLLMGVLPLLAFVVVYPLVLIFINSLTVTLFGAPVRQGLDNWRTASYRGRGGRGHPSVAALWGMAAAF